MSLLEGEGDCRCGVEDLPKTTVGMLSKNGGDGHGVVRGLWGGQPASWEREVHKVRYKTPSWYYLRSSWGTRRAAVGRGERRTTARGGRGAWMTAPEVLVGML